MLVYIGALVKMMSWSRDMVSSGQSTVFCSHRYSLGATMMMEFVYCGCSVAT